MHTRILRHAGIRRLVIPALLILVIVGVGAAGTAAGRTAQSAAPTITGITPTTAPNTGLVTVGVEGSGFDVRGRMTASLVLGSTAIDALLVRATRENRAQVKFDLTGAPPGVYDIVIGNEDGQKGTLAAAFTVTGVPAAKPQITKLKPTAGKRKSAVVITGTGFGASRGAGLSFVKFGTKKCTTYVSWADTSIKCKVPLKAPFGRVKVRVTTAGGVSNTMTFRVKKP